MDPESVKRGIVLFLGIVSAVMVADTLSEIIVPLSGITGAAASILRLLVYAGILFAVIYLLKRFAGIDIFGFGGDWSAGILAGFFLNEFQKKIILKTRKIFLKFFSSDRDFFSNAIIFFQKFFQKISDRKFPVKLVIHLRSGGHRNPGTSFEESLRILLVVRPSGTHYPKTALLFIYGALVALRRTFAVQ
jgi:hypothetical protein